MRPFVKPALALAAAGALTLTAATPSVARDGWLAAGAAGFAAGAIVGSAVANSYAYNSYAYDDTYAYAPGYYDAYAYAPGPVYSTRVYRSPRYYYRSYNNGPHRENQLTGSGAGFID